MRLHAVLLALSVPLFVSACAAIAPSYRDANTTIASKALFEPEKYTGLWYEIARFPVSFQKGCTAVTAEYTLQPDGTLSVLNSCRQDSPGGRLRQISGSAEITGPGRLSVSFRGIPFISAPYWVLWTDEDYQTAVVGTPNGRAGWILNRAPVMRADRLEAALEVLRFNGYDTSQITFTEH